MPQELTQLGRFLLCGAVWGGAARRGAVLTRARALVCVATWSSPWILAWTGGRATTSGPVTETIVPAATTASTVAWYAPAYKEHCHMIYACQKPRIKAPVNTDNQAPTNEVDKPHIPTDQLTLYGLGNAHTAQL